jgi:hypothetical protein
MAILQVKIPRPHAAQRKVLAEAKRFSVVCCGRRWGKSTLGIDRIVKPALEGFPCAWFSPSYKSLSESWRQIQAVLEPVITSRNNAEFRLEVRGGGSVTMWSLDNEVADLVRGRAYKVAILDEAAIVRNLLSVWENAIRPCLADHRGDAWFLSTPRGLGEFHGLWMRGQEGREDWASWKMPTASNPYIAPEEIEAARNDLSAAAFRQEWLADFVDWEGAVFRNVTESVWEVPDDFKRARRPNPFDTWLPTFAIGCDWGQRVDYSAFVVMCDLPDNADVVDVEGIELAMIADDGRRRPCAVVEVDRSNKVEYSLQRMRLKALWERYGRCPILAEQNSLGIPIIEQLRRDGVPVRPFVTSNKTKADIIEALALAFERREIRIPNNPVLIGELQSFQAETLASGVMRYAAAGAGHDDTVIATALALRCLRKNASAYSRSPRTIAAQQELATRMLTGGAN